MKKELSNEELIILENFIGSFKAYYEMFYDKKDFKQRIKELFYSICNENSINPYLAVDFLSSKFTEMNSGENRITTYKVFENMGELVDIGKKQLQKDDEER